MDINISQDNLAISVQDPVIRDAVKKYVAYAVKGVDSKGTFDSERRYSDFEALRKALV